MNLAKSVLNPTRVFSLASRRLTLPSPYRTFISCSPTPSSRAPPPHQSPGSSSRHRRSPASNSTMAKEYKLKGVTSLDLSPGDKQEVEVEGIPDAKVLLVNADGKIQATGAKCTHYGAPLVKGVLTKSGRLTCPWHGGKNGFSLATSYSITDSAQPASTQKPATLKTRQPSTASPSSASPSATAPSTSRARNPPSSRPVGSQTTNAPPPPTPKRTTSSSSAVVLEPLAPSRDSVRTASKVPSPSSPMRDTSPSTAPG